MVSRGALGGVVALSAVLALIAVGTLSPNGQVRQPLSRSCCRSRFNKEGGEKGLGQGRRCGSLRVGLLGFERGCCFRHMRCGF